LKKLITRTLFLSATLISLQVAAQSKLSGSAYTGILIPYNDFTENAYDGAQFNLGVGGALNYNLTEAFKLRGNLMMGNLNGSNGISFYRSRIIETGLEARFNAMSLLNTSSKVKIEPSLGGGIAFSSAALYDINTRARLAESPIPTEKSYSPNGYLVGGLELGLPVATNLDFNLGYTHRYVLPNDYLDAFASGTGNDHYGMVHVGLTFYLKSTRKPGTVEIEKKKYDDMRSRIDSLEAYTPEPDNSKIAQLEMTNKEQELEIENLKTKMDSLRAQKNTRTYASDNSQGPTYNPNTKAILGTPKYRIIVASLPSQVQAQRWIDRSSLDKQEMVVAYIQDLNTYRVVYRSMDTLEQAKKEVQQIKGTIPDAWIVKF
jgi:hypothetical protein